MNHYCPAGTTDPIECPAGTTCPTEGLIVATLCQDGTEVIEDDFGIKICSPCAEGYFSIDPTDECQLCEPGFLCYGPDPSNEFGT